MQHWDSFRRWLCADLIARDTIMQRARADAAEHKFNIVRNELTHLRDLLEAKAKQFSKQSAPKLPNDGGDSGSGSGSGGAGATA